MKKLMTLALGVCVSACLLSGCTSGDKAAVDAAVDAQKLAEQADAAADAAGAAADAAAEAADAAAEAADAASEVVEDAAGKAADAVVDAADKAAQEAEKDSDSTGDAAAFTTIESGKLIIGTNAAFPPFEYVGDDGNPDGFDIALIKAVGDKLGLEVEIQDMEFSSLVTAIGSKIDGAIAGMTVTEERQQMVDFSDSYYDAVQYVLLPADSTLAAADDLKGKNIGVQLGTTGNFIADEIEGASVNSYDKAVDAVNDLVNGRNDLVIVDKNPALVFEKNFEGKIKVIDGAQFGFENEQYAIALPKGSELTPAVNKALEELKASGEFDALVKLYIEGE